MQLCPHCGAPSSGGPACASCGRSLAPPAPPAMPPPSPSVHVAPAPAARVAPEPRPVGVLLVGIGFFLLAGGAALFALFLFFMGPAFAAAFDVFPLAPFGAAIGFFLVLFGFAALVFAGLTGALGYGVLHGHSWAWAGTLILAALGVLSSLSDVATGDYEGVLGVLAWGGVAYYFWLPETRAWFGRPA